MTDHANDAIPTIGPETERRIQMAFADTCLLTCQAAARLIGMDEKSLRALTDAGVIRAVRRGTGRNRAYTEGDIRAYLTQGEAPARVPKGKVTTHGQSKVVPFTQRKTGTRR
jgi:hypothetical protein